MRIGPFTVDVDALAAGMLDLIGQHPDGACLAFGMLPAEIMEAFEARLKEKIPDAYYDPGAERLEDRFGTDGAAIRRRISIAVTVAILRQATEQGKCVV